MHRCTRYAHMEENTCTGARAMHTWRKTRAPVHALCTHLKKACMYTGAIKSYIFDDTNLRPDFPDGREQDKKGKSSSVEVYNLGLEVQGLGFMV